MLKHSLASILAATVLMVAFALLAPPAPLAAPPHLATPQIEDSPGGVSSFLQGWWPFDLLESLAGTTCNAEDPCAEDACQPELCPCDSDPCAENACNPEACSGDGGGGGGGFEPHGNG